MVQPCTGYIFPHRAPRTAHRKIRGRQTFQLSRKKNRTAPPTPDHERTGGRTAFLPSSGERVGVSAEELHAGHLLAGQYSGPNAIHQYYSIPGIRYRTTVEVQDTCILPGTCLLLLCTNFYYNNNFRKSCHSPYGITFYHFCLPSDYVCSIASLVVDHP